MERIANSSGDETTLIFGENAQKGLYRKIKLP
jgi:hypothetical protein